MKNLNEKNYNEILQETSDYFAAQGMSIIGEGFKEISTNAALFESYVDQLTEGASANDAATMAQLMVNSNANIIKESSMTGIQPVASLSMPVIRKLWPKFALKNAIATEVAKTPRFVVTYTAPYMYKGTVDGDMEKVYLPRGLRDWNAQLNSEFPEALKKEYTTEHTVELGTGAARAIDFAFANGTNGDFDGKVVIANTPSAVKFQPLDELVLDHVLVKTSDTVVNASKVYFKRLEANKYERYFADVDENGVNDYNGTAIEGDVYEKVKIGKKLGVYGNQVYNVGKGQLIVQFDGANRKATFAAIGEDVAIICKAGVSSEFNEESWSVGFDIKRQDIDIPTGQHINAELPIEALNDMMALYQIDGTKETVDLMTNIFAQKLDLEILEFIKNSHFNQPNNEAFNGYPDAEEYTFAFDCKPAAGFAGSPKAWREEIKPLIDHLAQKIKNNTYLQAGMFSLIANPLDAQILANVDWQFRGGQGGNMDGVDVDYSVGTYVGANSYRVIASTNVPAGQMFLVFTPSSDTQMTYKYYPYTFSTEMGYISPNRSRTPSLLMTKRHTLHEFMPACGCILILNNDGRSYFVQHGEWNEGRGL